jgi:hypothetical protein
MRVNLRRVLQPAAIFMLVLVAGFATPWPGRGFIEGYCSLANVALGAMDYDGKVSAKLRPAPDSERRASDQVKTDATLDLRAMGYLGVHRVGVSLRRDVYAPMVLLWALLLAAPISRTGRVWSLCIGTTVVLAVGVLSSCVLVQFVVMNEAPKVHVASELTRSMTEFVFERWLTPPGNRVIAPLFLAGMLIGRWWPRAREVEAALSPSVTPEAVGQRIAQKPPAPPHYSQHGREK